MESSFATADNRRSERALPIRENHKTGQGLLGGISLEKWLDAANHTLLIKLYTSAGDNRKTSHDGDPICQGITFGRLQVISESIEFFTKKWLMMKSISSSLRETRCVKGTHLSANMRRM